MQPTTASACWDSDARWPAGLRSSNRYQRLNDSWDLDHPFERLLVDTAVRPDPSAVSWINPRLTRARSAAC